MKISLDSIILIKMSTVSCVREMLDSEIEFKYFFKTTLVPSQTSEANVELLLQ